VASPFVSALKAGAESWHSECFYRYLESNPENPVSAYDTYPLKGFAKRITQS
jgi:hypothetical protein